jgi:hypothetical protein
VSRTEELENVASLIERGIDTVERGDAQTFSIRGLPRADRAFAVLVARNVLAERCFPADVRARRDGIDVIPWLA